MTASAAQPLIPRVPPPGAGWRAWLLGCATALAAVSSGSASGSLEDFFETEIRPLLASRCVACHGPEKQEGGIRIDSREALVRGGLAAPGEPETSRLLAVARGEIPAPAPCRAEPRATDSLARWIAAGLPWPETATVGSLADLMATARHHWAFQPLGETSVPREGQAGGAGTVIDAFVLAKLEETGLDPSPEASRRELARRLSYALTGLPPAPEAVERFTADTDPRAYERLVDSLLESRHFGEHWARHWLDLARYSDTKGYVYAREEKQWPHAWVYRDWVVDAFNEDLPYDRFLLLQIAADQIADRRPGDLAAMGFLTLGRRFLGVSHDIIDDRIDVVTRAALGLTVSCARCHDHKYDPIPAADYYALHGVFASSVERLAPIDDWEDAGDESFREEFRALLEKNRATLEEKKEEVSARVRERAEDYLRAQTSLEDYPPDTFGQIIQKTDLIPAFVRRWEDYLRQAGRDGDPLWKPWHAYAALAPEDFAAGAASVAENLRAEDAALPAPLAAAFAEPPASFEDVIQRYGALLRDSAARRGAAEADASPETPDYPGGADLFARVLHGEESPCGFPQGSLADIESYFDNATVTELWKLQGALDRAILTSPGPLRYALVLADREAPVTSRVLLRGNPLTPGEEAPRRFLSILSGEEGQEFARGSGRLELARAIASPDNPLAARVMVNRVWTQLFGQGLVETPSDFGTRAEPPTHPELLDWLSRRFIDQGWSVKRLVRDIVVSAAWRQSSSGPAQPGARRLALAEDPANRLLWRMTPRRLGYEELRDSLFAVSGELDLAPGGKPVDLLRAPFPPRRALYGKVDRQFLPGLLRAFDFASPDLHVPRRPETTVPQQALFFLNHPLALERARALAAVAASEGLALPDQVSELIRRAWQREPEPGEIAEALAFLADLAPVDGAVSSPGIPEWSYGFGAYEEDTQRVIGFTPLPHFTGKSWQGGPAFPDPELGWARLTAEGGHPGNTRDRAATRRWTAPRAATLSITSKLAHEPKEGDGIRAFVVSSRAGLLGSARIHAESVDLEVASLSVEAGESIDFLVDIGEGLSHDQFLWSITVIEMDSSENGSAPAMAWDARRDFPEDAAAALTAWEQLAQALLCSNEFFFVD